MNMANARQISNAHIVFDGSIKHLRLAIAVAVLFITLTGAGLLRLVKDPATDSLIPPDHASIQMRDYAEEIFGLRDPIVVAVTSKAPEGIFTPEGLRALRDTHAFIAETQNVRADRTISIASESRVHGTDDALLIERFFETAPDTQAEANAVRRQVFASTPHIGSLVAADARGALVVAELYDETLAGDTYKTIADHVSTLEIDGLTFYVAGRGAVTGHLSQLIDLDSRRLPPIAALIIFVLIFAAFGRWRALIAPLVVVLATLFGAIGTMAWLGIPYYVITGSLPVILIAIAVADSVHILAGYYERRAAIPAAPCRQVVVDTMVDLWRPLTLTSFTTMAGFIGIALASVMPPMVWFGWFAALGVFIAWAVSLFVLPPVLVMLDLVSSPRIKAGQLGRIATLLTSVALNVARQPRRAMAALGVLMLVAVTFATGVRVNNSTIENFHKSEPIRKADETLNSHFAGTAYLDVIVEADTIDGLLSAARMKKVAALQDFLETQPYVEKTTSIADYISELHVALTGAEAGAMPDSSDAIAQYLLLYESSGNPSDLEDEIDIDYQRALVRAFLTSRNTADQAPVVDALSAYLVNQFNEPGLNGMIGGRVNVDYHWMRQLKESHMRSVLLSLVAVFTIAALLFRSASMGLLALVPVGAALVAVYGLMGATGIFIEPGTSMFAAIAIGVGVDFSIHFIDRLQKGVHEESLSLEAAIAARFPTSARACFLNAAMLAIGFSVLMTSALPPVFKLGLLISVASASSFIGGFVVTTAVFALRRSQISTSSAKALAGLAICVSGIMIFAGSADAEDISTLTGRQIAERIHARDDGDYLSRNVRIAIVDRRGRERVRTARVFRRKVDGATQSAIFYMTPNALRDTAFLTHDHDDGHTSDRQWLFLPAARRPKQIPVSDRGEYFLGTDFTYEDIRSELKLDLEDYKFERLPEEPGDIVNTIRLRATPIDQSTARELGYGEIRALIDTTNWLPLTIEFDDPRARPLKRIDVSQVENIDGIWMAMCVEAVNFQDNHQTRFVYTDVKFDSELTDRLFSPQGLRQGAP